MASLLAEASEAGRRATGSFVGAPTRLASASRTSPATVTVFAAAGSAAAVGAVVAWRYTHHARPAALIEHEPGLEVRTLDGLADDEQALETLQRELLAEWGAFGPRNMAEMRRMAANAGRLVYVIGHEEDDRFEPAGVLQTALADVGGDPERLRELYPSFAALTSNGTWSASRDMAGDTAVLLQITVFGERSRGIGSRFRDQVLDSLPSEVRFALTTTPVDGDAVLHAEAEDGLPPAARFHYRGGARPRGFVPGFKTPNSRRAASLGTGRHPETDVVFMRYERLRGEWSRPGAPRHGLPVRQRLALAVRRLTPARAAA